MSRAFKINNVIFTNFNQSNFFNQFPFYKLT